MGIAIIWIVFHHMQYFNLYAFPITDYLIRAGSCGVDIFLFLSSFGLYHALQRNKSLINYYKRRCKRILPAFCLFVTIKDIIFSPEKIVSLESWYIELRNNWFISFILIVYLIYPLMYKIQIKYRYLPLALSVVVSIALTVFLVIIERDSIHAIYMLMAQRFPIFALGSLVAETDMLQNIKPSIRRYFFLLLSCIGVSLVFYENADVLLYPLFFFIAPIIISQLSMINYNQIISKITRTFGNLSLEIYLIHMLIIPLLVYHSINGVLGIILVLILSFIIAYILHNLTEVFKKLFA